MPIHSPIKSFKADLLEVQIFQGADALAETVAARVQKALAIALAQRESAAMILATGNSQIRFLKALVALGGVEWSRVTLFHMDEYLGIDEAHPASFRRYLRERVESLVTPGNFHYIRGDADLPLDECERYTNLLRNQSIDVVCLGIGENGHIAFNDPPVARFDDSHWVKLVKLDEACKRQQVKEGHFPNIDAVPAYAYTLTIPALCAAQRMYCLAPELRKAEPVRRALQGPVSTECPASILRRQAHAELLLDPESASLL